eukprot:Seg110.6 transcript_id=Seg110.6/GoldUCD/mRNA.D3Y31 product="Fibroblast growth factor 14" protein_id=Seg110.6/GoldUCD/D3Y31
MSFDCFELTKSHTKSSRIRRIQCENGLFFEVLCDGSLSGVKEGTTDYGVFHLYSMGPNLVVIRNIMTGLFLSADEAALTTKEFFGDDCVFQEVLTERFYVYYRSYSQDIDSHRVLCMETNGLSAMKSLDHNIINCLPRGTLFKTLTIPEKQYRHFCSVARSLEG